MLIPNPPAAALLAFELDFIFEYKRSNTLSGAPSVNLVPPLLDVLVTVTKVVEEEADTLVVAGLEMMVAAEVEVTSSLNSEG